MSSINNVKSSNVQRLHGAMETIHAIDNALVLNDTSSEYRASVREAWLDLIVRIERTLPMTAVHVRSPFQKNRLRFRVGETLVDIRPTFSGLSVVVMFADGDSEHLHNGRVASPLWADVHAAFFRWAVEPCPHDYLMPLLP